jgi:hypothetical protein
MKKIIAFASVLMMAGSLMAQGVNYYMATQQAKRDSAQNDAEQQRIAHEAGGQQNGPSGPAGGTASPAPMDPVLQATLKNVSSLQTDFAATINSASDTPDPSQKVALLNDLTQAAQGTSKATSSSVKKVADDLLTALGGKKKLTATQQTKLAREIHALFNSSHLTATQQDTVLNDIQKTLTDGGASLDAAVNLVTDLKEVVAETK